jgi:hypothetical protein
MTFSANAGVFVLTDGGSLVPMHAASFATEVDFQTLLARFPELLAGDQIDAANPRRFMLLNQEQPIADAPGGSDRWFLDHLLVDQDAIPTLVEVKRSTDTRIRREVVGQMLDYAANATANWFPEQLRDQFVAKWVGDREPGEVLAEKLGPSMDWDAFWSAFAANLSAGRIRLLFVADVIPMELRRIVEFLNAQMRPAEVLAVELRHFEGNGLKTLAPIVLGQTQRALEQKSAASRPRRQWDEASMMEAIRQRGNAKAAEIAAAVFEWMHERAPRPIIFSDSPTYGSAYPEFLVHGRVYVPCRLGTEASVTLNFNQLARLPAFQDAAARQELLYVLQSFMGPELQDSAMDRQVYVRLNRVESSWGLLHVLNQVVDLLTGVVVAGGKRADTTVSTS